MTPRRNLPLPFGQSALRTWLLGGASALALGAASGPAVAQSVAGLRAAAGISPSAGLSVPEAAIPSAAVLQAQQYSSASVQALHSQAQAAQAMSLATQAQAAARAAAAAVTATVPNGLGPGGLQPVANPVSAAADGARAGYIGGLNTWQGATAPVQTTVAGGVQVAIQQTESRALLSWESLNVGRDTTLVFNQTSGGQAQPGWTVLNRVVGGLNPATGLRDPSRGSSPSQILGAIKADGAVIILNQNGVLFGGAAQVNTRSLLVSSLEIGRATANAALLTIADRNDEYLRLGLLGYADQNPLVVSAYTVSAQALPSGDDPALEGTVTVQSGARLTSQGGGYLILAAPRVVNAGALSAPEGQVTLQSGRQITLQRSEGASDSPDPNVRGLIATSAATTASNGNNVRNTGIIDAPRGYVALGASAGGAVLQEGVLSATTSISRNGVVDITGGDIRLGPSSVLSITPDAGGDTIPKDPVSIAAYKTSKARIGSAQSRIDIGANSLIYAPSGDVTIGAGAGEATQSAVPGSDASRIFVDSGAVIDVGGLQDVSVPASRNTVQINPVKRNELRDTPNYKTSFLNGALVVVDPRVSGVRADGVAYVGSPLIEAGSYAEQVGVTVSELMTKGGAISLGVQSLNPNDGAANAPDVIAKVGSVFNISGGSVRYEAGTVQTTRLISASGAVVDIGVADPNDTYVGVYDGYERTQSRWGVTRTYANPLLQGTRQEGAYSEGRDAGSLTLKASAIGFDGSLIASSLAGPQQRLKAEPGAAAPVLYGDGRRLQAAPSQLPSGGLLVVQALGRDTRVTGQITGGASVSLVSAGQLEALPADLGYNAPVSVSSAGSLVLPPFNGPSQLPAGRLQTIALSADSLSSSGLAQLTVKTSGAFDIRAEARLDLQPGGVLDVLAGRTITVDGAVSAPSGKISLATSDLGIGPQTSALTRGPGAFDIVVNGQLSVAGRWVNDANAPADGLTGASYLNGGAISLTAAPRASATAETASRTAALAGQAGTRQNTDFSGSILVNSGARLDLSGGGYVNTDGSLVLSSRGGDLSLRSDTAYFQLKRDPTNRTAGGIEGFRVTTLADAFGGVFVPVNPSQIASRIELADGAIQAHGFAGGGTFSLSTPSFDFGAAPAASGATLPLNFFPDAGFANYSITSYKTALLPNLFDNGLGGYNAVLATQTVSVAAGQTLSLTQSQFNPIVDPTQTERLRGLRTGASVYSVLKPEVPTAAWDQKPISLSLNGLLELHVESGGRIVGAPGAALSAGGILNRGSIRLPGGTLSQAEVLPDLYAGSGAVAVRDLKDVFGSNGAGGYSEAASNSLGLRDGIGPVLTNAELVASRPIYLLGELGAQEGLRLASGSVTDLGGVSILNPRAPTRGADQLVTGKILDGGVVQTSAIQQVDRSVFNAQYNPESPLNIAGQTSVRAVRAFTAESGAKLNLSGAADTYDQRTDTGYERTAVWSNAGTLRLNGAATVSGADIQARGGAPLARGGVLIATDPVLSQATPTTPTANLFSADAIAASGFDTLVALGSLNSTGDVDLRLGRALIVASRVYGGQISGDLSDPLVRDQFAPRIGAGGRLDITAPFVSFQSDFQTLASPLYGAPGTAQATFHADQVDVRGAVLFDRSVGRLVLDVNGPVRFIGVQPWQFLFGGDTSTESASVAGHLAVNGSLAVTATQVYPTTGSSIRVTALAPDSTISFAGRGAAPTAPYSAGGSLTVQANTILQGGVLRAPSGGLSLGSSESLLIGGETFAPVTRSVTLAPGSVTSVSNEGLSIPYGTTTDQKEYFFAPTSSESLKKPPAGVLRLQGDTIDLQAGANLNLAGGGDLYAYEFVPGTGGSRDVLDRFNPDTFSGVRGLQYPDGRQVYAIVPGLSAQTIASFDPIYSTDYSDLYGPTGAGRRVYLSAAPGLAAGWYTLLPAKYALLPGGMRVVESVGVAAVAGQASQLPDGTVTVAGRYGDAPSKAEDSSWRAFTVQSQDVIRSYSNIALTSATAAFTTKANHDEAPIPRLPGDAARLVLKPVLSLNLGADFNTAPGDKGRGAQVDIGGRDLAIVSPDVAAPALTVALSADGLSRIKAASLLVGGERTELDDGRTSLDVSTRNLTVQNDAAHPLTAGETLLAVDGDLAALTIRSGSVIKATGTGDDSRTEDIVIGGIQADRRGRGAMVRVSANPQRALTRLDYENNRPATLTIEDAQLSGASLLMDSSAGFNLGRGADLQAQSIALGAGAVSFSDSIAGLQGLVIDSVLLPKLQLAQNLSVRSKSAIAIAGRSYAFQNLALDTPGLTLLAGAQTVAITADTLRLGNSRADLGACGVGGSPICSGGSLQIDAKQIVFRSGTIRTYGFGGKVALSAPGGVFAEGQAGLDVAGAELSLLTPFVGERAGWLTTDRRQVIPSLALTTSGALTLAGPAVATAPTAEAVPGAGLALRGGSVAISDVRLRATAGQLTVRSATGVTIGGAAVLEAPAYSREFGDALDSYKVSAPGGQLAITALAGDIALGDKATLSVGGGDGKAGGLGLLARNGAVRLDGVLVGDKAGGAGGGFTLESGSAFDLSAFERKWGSVFNGAISIRTLGGDLVLAPDLVARAMSYSLTADGGKVDIAGTIDTSGVNGGDISLFGSTGTVLKATGRLTARASGYADDDTRRAEGGQVTLGVGGGGGIAVESGAQIDVSASRTAGRLVALKRNGATVYSYAQADDGGSLVLRARVVTQAGPDTLNADFAGTLTGAREVVVEGYKAFDLASIAADPSFSGVAIVGGDAVLTPGAAANDFLTGTGAGSIVDFVQGFDVSGAYARLGALSSLATFHARPGVQLDFNGNMRLEGDWNLGAGTVDVAGAVGAGLMASAPGLAGRFYVIPGKEAEVFTRYTALRYRTGGLVTGEPGVLTLRATGNLTLNGSLTDGFFQFREQTDSAYLLAAIALQSPLFAPYSASGNLAHPEGGLASGAGDPVGSAELFPRLIGASGRTTAALSWSLTLVGGADPGSTASGDTQRTVTGGGGNVAVTGDRAYNYGLPDVNTGVPRFTAEARSVVRTGDGSIKVAAAGDIDLTNGPAAFRSVGNNRPRAANAGGLQVGGTAIYTAGVRADPAALSAIDPATGQTVSVDPAPYGAIADNFGLPGGPSYRYGAGAQDAFSGFGGILIANPVIAERGGDLSLAAGRDILGRRDLWQQYRISNGLVNGGVAWIGPADQPWRVGVIGDVSTDRPNGTTVRINPQLFQEGLATLGGGDLSISAGRNIADITIAADTALATASARPAGGAQTRALLTFGGGDLALAAGGDLIGGRIDLASGAGSVKLQGSVRPAANIVRQPNGAATTNLARLRVSDAVLDIEARGSIEIQGVSALGVRGRATTPNQTDANLNALGAYSNAAGVSLTSNGPVTVRNTGVELLTGRSALWGSNQYAIYPGSFGATSLVDDVTLASGAGLDAINGLILYPTPRGSLSIAAGRDLLSVPLSMDDIDPGLIPGFFSAFRTTLGNTVVGGRPFLAPTFLPNTTTVERALEHNRDITHLGDPIPNRIYAGRDINQLLLSVPKETRIGAGRDIVDMAFFGQNTDAGDITRIRAGRDITSSLSLLRPLIGLPNLLGSPLATVRGNTFQLGGPGGLFIEAGRDAGPFLNSVVTEGFVQSEGNVFTKTRLTFPGGILTVGNSWNPWLPDTGADIVTAFGVAKGIDLAALRETYLNPANVDKLDDALFVQVKGANGGSTADRSRPIYGPVLVEWMRANAQPELLAAYGSLNVTVAQAYKAFAALPLLRQETFLLRSVYFNELTQTSRPDSPSYKKYSRGYNAVNTLFPASLGYTANDLSGGSNGANAAVHTGDLDLRLSTIQTARGGDIFLLGPGGQLLAGSTVRTSEQAARRAYDGGRLFSFGSAFGPVVSPIKSTPTGLEGILTLRGGGIYSFTDQSLILNQSRLFTLAGGDIALWSSNGDLNAGQGPKTSANFPPVVVRIDENGAAVVDRTGGVSGAGIAAFQPAVGVASPNVFLIAPRGTVDAGDAGVRVAGNLFIAAQSVANADNFSVGGAAFGIPAATTIDVGVQSSANAASAAAEQAAKAAANPTAGISPSIITVNVLGAVDEPPPCDEAKDPKCKAP